MTPQTLVKYLAISLLGLSSSVVLAQNDDLELTANQQQLSFVLPESAITDNSSNIAVELDGYDISMLSQVSDNTLTITLETPLAQGRHNLLVLQFMDNGDIESLLDQPLTVVSNEFNHSNSWQINTTLSGNYNINQDENAEAAGIKRGSGNGALSINGQEQFGSFELKTEIEAIYDTVSANDPDENNWSLPNYRLTIGHQGERMHSNVAVGNIFIEQNNLLFSGYQRRGVMAKIGNPEGNYHLSAFGLQAKPSSRYNGDLFVPETSLNRSAGITMGTALVDQYLQINTAYIEGRTSLGAFGIINFEDPTVYGGNSWNLALDSRWLSNSLWLHAEYAESKFDSDGINIGEKAERDDAIQATLQLSSNGDIGAGWFDYWNAHLQYQNVGRDYYSVGNLSLPGNLALTRGTFQSGKGGININATWSEEKTNINNDPTLPTQTLERKGATFNYSPLGLNPDSWLWSTIGSPSLATSFYRTNHSQGDEDSQIAGYDLDNSADESSITLTFTRTHWNWSIQQQLIKQDDKSKVVIQNGYTLYEAPSDLHNRLTALQLGWIPNERVSINMQLQRNKRLETDFKNDYSNLNYGINANLNLIPKTLSLMFNYNFGQNSSHLYNSDFIEDDFRSHFGNTQLTWHALKARNKRPSINCYLRGSYGKQDNRAFNQVNKQWTALIGIEVQWAGGGQQ